MRWLALLMVTFSCTLTYARAEADCADLLPKPISKSPSRDVNALDIARIRDIGRPENNETGPSPISLSPDGSKVGFVLLRADPATNSYCRALVVVPTRGGNARTIDTAGDPIFVTFNDHRGMVYPTGIHAIITPAWSPDGESIAYVRRTGDAVNPRIVHTDGRDAYTVPGKIAGLEQVRWNRDGTRIVTVSRPAIQEEEHSIDEEGRSGWLFDRRVMPVARPRPFPPGPVKYVFQSVDPATGAIMPAKPSEQMFYPDLINMTQFHDALLTSETSSGWRVWSREIDPKHYPSPERLEIEAPDGKRFTCDDPACATEVSNAWWREDAGALLIQRREGWGRSETALYLWTPGKAARRIFGTHDILIGCQLGQSDLFCVSDGSRTASRIVAIALGTGKQRLIFDANPELGSLRLGKTQRLEWKTKAGVEGFGDLILPPGHRTGERHPLVVVQYRTRGFLRGGTGDEYPIYALAARGFAVLSFDVPKTYATSLGHGPWPDWISSAREDVRNWNDRRNILQSLIAGIDRAAATGAIDQARIGLSGLSDGSTTALFALVNTDIFKTVSVSSCCEDPHTYLMLGGEAFASVRKQTGFPAVSTDAPDFWRDYAIAPNADRINTPILMQLSDDEYLISLESYWAFKDRQKPIELHIFPDEYHIKWQPAHRVAIYNRNLDWFSFWLQDREDPDPGKAAQYARWRQLKKQWLEAKVKAAP